jgi:hypothetical protein
MRIERSTDQLSESRIYDGAHCIGHIRDGAVAFHGFASETDAAEAAHIAHRALTRRRSKATWASEAPDGYFVWNRPDGRHVVAESGLLARILAPDPEKPEDHWGFEVRLLPEENVSVFAMSRARTMWQALRWAGLTRRMSQFRHDPVASGDLSIADAVPA